ncbi:MAG TPA: 2-dehydropantoate 2-reductase [Candidatus Methylomirabilis sp.]|nr:2-dehydropantoate 2-reductase [Candidatus Methylomirabilis sp.]
MKIVVLGAGALGSIVGAHLLRAGHDVTLIARERRARTLVERGLVLTGLAEFALPATVTTDPRTVRNADALLVTVKTYDTEEALASVRHLDVPTVVSLQNGVLKNEQLARVFGGERVVGAAATVAGEIVTDGAVRFTLNDRLALGEVPTGTSPRVAALVSALAEAGLRADVSSNIQCVEWSKLALFVSGGAVAALTRLPTGQFLSDPDGARLVVQLVQDVGRMASNLAIPLEDAGLLPIETLCRDPLPTAVERVQQVGAAIAARAPMHKISILQDLERGRRLEIEETLGHVVRQAAALGVPVPTIDTCYRLLAVVDRRER